MTEKNDMQTTKTTTKMNKQCVVKTKIYYKLIIYFYPYKIKTHYTNILYVYKK